MGFRFVGVYVAEIVGVGYFSVGKNYYFLMQKMVPVPVTRSEGRR